MSTPEEKKAAQLRIIEEMHKNLGLNPDGTKAPEEPKKDDFAVPEDNEKKDDEKEKKDKEDKPEPPRNPTPTPPETPDKLTAKQKLIKEIGKILDAHNNMECNIPVEHVYWSLVNRYRGMP